MVKVNFLNKQKLLPLPNGTKALIRNACKAVLQTENFTESAEINISFVDDESIRQINNEFRLVDKSTDVLSFPMGENGEYDINPENGCKMLGDIVISVEHAISQAELFGHSNEREIGYLTVHSVLHLLGYDHMDEGKEKKLMRAKEEEALSLLGLEIK